MRERYRHDTDVMSGYQIFNSSNVEYVGWTTEGMVVLFKGGTAYLYKGVSRQRAVACAYAKSVGRYINQNIKPKFNVVKVV